MGMTPEEIEAGLTRKARLADAAKASSESRERHKEREISRFVVPDEIPFDDEAQFMIEESILAEARKLGMPRFCIADEEFGLERWLLVEIAQEEQALCDHLVEIAQEAWGADLEPEEIREIVVARCRRYRGLSVESD